MATKKQVGGATGFAAIIAAILALLAGQQPSTPSPSVPTTTTSTTTTTTAPGEGVDYGRRFFADTASWNQPVSSYGFAAEPGDYASRYWNHAGGAAPPGTLTVAFERYSVPIYDRQDATTTARVYQTTALQAQQRISQRGLTFGSTVPWNPAWTPGEGNDSVLIVVDRVTGDVWEYWGIGQPSINCTEVFGLGPNSRAGFSTTNPRHLCGYSYAHWKGLYEVTDGTTISGRGMGVNKLALVTTPHEVASGTIRHALEMTITATMYGPECAPDTPGAGTTCGYYLPPATRLELSDATQVARMCNTTAPLPRTDTIPEGMRFAVDISDKQIDEWLDDRGYVSSKRETARIFAVAFRDYGFIVAETGCYGSTMQVDGLQNPRSAGVWATLGIEPTDPTIGDLMDGLMTDSNLKVVAAP